MIALDSAFQHIIPVCPGKIKKFYKKLKNPILDHSKIFFGKTGFFPGNPALSLFIIYDSLNNCQKSWQSLVRLSAKGDYQTNKPINK